MGLAAAELVADSATFYGTSTQSQTTGSPSSITSNLASNNIKKGPATALQYGPTQGTLSYRCELAAFLNEQYGVAPGNRSTGTQEVEDALVDHHQLHSRVNESELFQTNGATG
ncbi:unnamed protein product, partial [Amoebophrya sp. A25]|eukprot:GSA25T00013257001.1